MRTASGSLATHLDQEATSLARIWEVTRTDGVVLRLTDHDVDLSVGGNTYHSSSGFTASSVLTATGGDIQGVTLTLPAQDELVSTSDVLASLYRHAQCSLKIVNWQAPDAGSMYLFGGEVRWSELDDEKRLVMEIAGLLSRSRFIEIESYSSMCRADLGDSRCQFDIDSLKETFTVDTVSSKVKLLTEELNQADEYWTLGVAHFLTGNNAGIAMEVRKSKQSNKSIEFFLATPFQVQVGDTGEVWPGCDKSPTMCHTRYDNIVNFRGEAFLALDTVSASGRYT